MQDEFCCPDAAPSACCSSAESFAICVGDFDGALVFCAAFFAGADLLGELGFVLVDCGFWLLLANCGGCFAVAGLFVCESALRSELLEGCCFSCGCAWLSASGCGPFFVRLLRFAGRTQARILFGVRYADEIRQFLILLQFELR